VQMILKQLSLSSRNKREISLSSSEREKLNHYHGHYRHLLGYLFFFSIFFSIFFIFFWSLPFLLLIHVWRCCKIAFTASFVTLFLLWVFLVCVSHLTGRVIPFVSRIVFLALKFQSLLSLPWFSEYVCLLSKRGILRLSC
jgi:hypothetical protein